MSLPIYARPTPGSEIEIPDPGTQAVTATSFELRQMIEELGLQDIVGGSDINYFATEIRQGNITQLGVRNFLMQQPEYLERKAEEERERATEYLGRTGEEFLRTRALPEVERVSARLGGRNRASTEAALSGAARDVALQSALNQEQFMREDYLNQQNALYQQAMTQWQNMVGFQQLKKQQTFQATQQKEAQIYGTRERESSQQWQMQLANLQRQWQQEDEKKARKQSIWGSILGFGGQLASGAAFGALLPGITAGKGLLAGITGMNPFGRR